MNDDLQDEPASAQIPEEAVGPAFGPVFFASVLRDRVAEVCEAQRDQTPVVLVQLGDGTSLDLCHVLALGPQYVVALVYRDPSSCTDMDVVFVPYHLITWVSVGMHSRVSRPLGFRMVPQEAPALA